MTPTLGFPPVTDLLAPPGAAVILAQPSGDALAMPLVPSATALFSPRGACLVSEAGPLWVADTGHHRLLGWRQRPDRDGQPADWVIGQADFGQEGQNGQGKPGAATVSVPTGICACGEGLAVADAWNHRVLIWQQVPQASQVPADLVLGQADFHQNLPNRGDLNTAADRMHWPYGVFYHQGCLWVADTGNRRVLVWQGLPTRNGQPADWVLGQPDLTTRNENGGGSPTAASLRWPHALTVWQGQLAIADAGNNRILIWDGIPTENNAPSAVVLGQANFESVELNGGDYWPSAATVSMPYGIAAAGDWLIGADTANSRLLGWKGKVSVGSPAQAIAGQSHWQSKSENRSYGKAGRNSLCWPYSIQICGKTAVIADSGNHRILLWSLNHDLF